MLLHCTPDASAVVGSTYAPISFIVTACLSSYAACVETTAFRVVVRIGKGVLRIYL